MAYLRVLARPKTARNNDMENLGTAGLENTGLSQPGGKGEGVVDSQVRTGVSCRPLRAATLGKEDESNCLG